MSENGFISLNNQSIYADLKTSRGAPDKVHLPQAVGIIRQDTEVPPAHLWQQCQLRTSTDEELAGNTNDS